MVVVDRISEISHRVQREGFRWCVKRLTEALRDRVLPPWSILYWLPIADKREPQVSTTGPAMTESLRSLLSRLIQMVELRVVKDLHELKPHEYQALRDSVGASAIPLYEQRLSQGAELHVLFAGQHVAGTLFFVFGGSHRFQHMVLTDRDAMALDGRIDPRFRGRGLYPVFLSLSISALHQKGIERLFIETSEHNEEAKRSFVCLGFHFLLKYKMSRGQYRYDIKAL